MIDPFGDGSVLPFFLLLTLHLLEYSFLAVERNYLIMNEKRVSTVAVLGTVEIAFLLTINTLHSTGL